MLYETQKDLDNELIAVNRFCDFTESKPYKLPMVSEADYILVRGNDVKAIVEVKCRTTPMFKYDDYLISNKKYTSLEAWAAKGLTPILLIQWSDNLGFVKLPVDHNKGVGGRYDRGPTVGVEPVALIPISSFTIID